MTTKSTFNPKDQENDLHSKVLIGLQRIGEAFKALLWENAKVLGLSPIQIQILIFIAYHKSEFCNVSYLSKEFNVTKPTISDAVRVLHKKELVFKDFATEDSRSYLLQLTESGKKTVQQTENFASPIYDQIQKIPSADVTSIYKTISQLIYQLNQNQLLSVQRTCYRCKFYDSKNNQHYCDLLKTTLHHNDIRLDCSEFESKT